MSAPNVNPSGCCGVQTSCCDDAISPSLHVDATDSQCGPGSGGTAAWDGEWWVGDVGVECQESEDPCGPVTVRMRFRCEDLPGWEAEYSCNGSGWGPMVHEFSQCDPIELVFTAESPCGCNGSVTFVVTE